MEHIQNNKKWFKEDLRFFLLKNGAADAICKFDIIKPMFFNGFDFFSSNTPCFQQNKGIAVIFRLDAVEIVCCDIFPILLI